MSSADAFLLPTIDPVADPALTAVLQRKLDNKTKPLGSLGRLESLVLRLGLIQGSEAPVLKLPQLVVFAADHGLADEGVSAYPQAVTAQMVMNMLLGGAAINVLARQHGFALTVVDAGISTHLNEDAEALAGVGAVRLLRRKIGFGTRNMSLRAAMSLEQAVAALHAGMDVVQGLPGNVVAFGEMGIANSSSAALLLARLCGVPLDDAVGRGTGLNDAQLQHKTEVLDRVLRRHSHLVQPLDILASVGGFEIAMMAGAMLRAASQRRVILVDGFIAGAAALVARSLCDAVTDYMVFGHRSAEAGHRLMLIHLAADPLLTLDLRLGEGSGALLAWPLLASATALLADMANFESAGVSQAAAAQTPVADAAPAEPAVPSIAPHAPEA